MVCSPPGSSVHVISQARILDWVAISSSRGSSWPRDWTYISYIAGRLFTAEPPAKPWNWMLFFSRSVMSDSLQPHGLQPTRLPCPSTAPRICSNSWPLSQWCQTQFSPQPIPPIRKLAQASYLHPSEGRQNENHNHRNWMRPLKIWIVCERASGWRRNTNASGNWLSLAFPPREEGLDLRAAGTQADVSLRHSRNPWLPSIQTHTHTHTHAHTEAHQHTSFRRLASNSTTACARAEPGTPGRGLLCQCLLV